MICTILQYINTVSKPTLLLLTYILLLSNYTISEKLLIYVHSGIQLYCSVLATFISGVSCADGSRSERCCSHLSSCTISINLYI